MPDLNSRYLLPTLLIVGTILVDGLSSVLLDQRYTNDYIGTAWIGGIIGQVAVLVGWLAWGRLHVVLRLAVVLSSIFMLAVSMVLVVHDDVLELMSSLLFFSAFFAVPAAIVRIVGFRFTYRRVEGCFATANIDAKGPMDVTTGLRTWQFSLATLFSWTTCAALLMCVMQWLDFPQNMVKMVVVFFVGFATIAGAISWAALVSKRPLLRTLIVGTLSIPACVALALVEGRRFDDETLMVSLAFTFYCLLAAIVLRVAGYRIERGPKRVDASTDADLTGEDKCRD